VTPLLRGTVAQNSGIAAVIPAERILKILQTPRARAKTLLAIANTYLQDGKYADADRFFNESIRMSEQAVGVSHPDVADSLEGYTILLRKQNRVSEVAKAEARAREIRAKNNPTRVPQ
jgi:tetratricopeptide repeat protein